MATRHIIFSELTTVIRRNVAIIVRVFLLWTFGLGITAGAQEAMSALNSKGVMPRRFPNPPHAIFPARRATHLPAAAREAESSNPKEIVLHHFVSPPRGAYPATGVIRDSEGNLYGTTNGSYSDIGGGGVHDAGVVFKVDVSGNETVLYSFTGGNDGDFPNGLVRDSAGNLYGTANSGGASGEGVVFEIDTSGNETVLYSFTGGNDGGNPSVVVRDSKGNLCGTASGGGASGYGVVFRIDGSGNEKVLYSFEGKADGGLPGSNVALDSMGNFYGTTDYGGNHTGGSGNGVVFKIDPSGHETVLYTFMGGSDGAYPNGVTRDSNGCLYGTTSNGGTSGAGVVFKIEPSGHEKVLYAFNGGNDGGYSDSGVTLGRDGTL